MLVVGRVGVCFEMGLEGPSFPEKERVSRPLQTPTPNYIIYLRGEGNYKQARFVSEGRGG